MSILKKKALAFLARRDFAYNELFHKLKQYSNDHNELHSILKDLQLKGLLSEERYISNYINTKQRKYGLLKIKYMLQNKSDCHELIDELISHAKVNEFNTAYSLWQKRFGDICDKKQIERGIRFLQSRGFSFTIINKVLKLMKIIGVGDTE